VNAFDIPAGRAAMNERGETAAIYFAIVMGVLAHFVWEILAASIRDNVKPDFGDWWLIAARIGVALIVSAVCFVGIYKQLDGADPKVRLFLAFTQGFAIDALTSPLGPVTTGEAAT
jgi:uncharacterized membrane protein YhhN